MPWVADGREFFRVRWILRICLTDSSGQGMGFYLWWCVWLGVTLRTVKVCIRLKLIIVLFRSIDYVFNNISHPLNVAVCFFLHSLRQAST
jgi:hypothetical protein